jgi:hypothetical protein
MPGPIVPVAVIAPAEQEVVVGSVAKLDGRSSLDPNDVGLTYTWSFGQFPIGSQVALFGFINLETDASVVSFAPDITGTYKIRLVVSDGTDTSIPTESIVDVRVILVPHHQGFVPDASFIWNYLSDFWNLVPDKKRFETVWSSMIQVTSSEMLKLYQYQYNRSIRDIQETIQKRWINFAPSLELDRDQTSFILSEDVAGSLASTFVIDSRTGVSNASQPTYSNIVTVPKTEGDFTKTTFGSATAIGKLLRLGRRTFTLARTSATFQSLNHGTDGSTSGLDVFVGSQFTSDMVGATLRILGPSSSPLVGDYLIDTFTSITQIEISNPPVGVTWTGSSGLEYTVLPATALSTSFFADRAQVPAALSNQHWRMDSVLISGQYDFDEQGVSVGDLIEIEIFRLDLQVLSTFFVQVTAVDRNRLSFVFNLEDLVDGDPAGGLSSDIQITLAADLIVPGLSADINGNLVYTLLAATVNSTVTSIRFKRTYFEKTLTTSDEIDVGGFSISARPVRVIRNSKIAVDQKIVSVPILQEYIKQPDIITEDGSIFFVGPEGIRTQVPRAPYLLAENLDYVIDDESTVSGTCQTQQGNDHITVPFGDLIDRSVTEGDILEVTQGTTSETFDIRKVIAADTLQVSPEPTITSTSALFTIVRRISGKFIRFVDDVFSKTAPAPTRLWSEVTYLDNQNAIEGNFGVLVGVRREDLERVGSGISYKNAVAGLMYALSRGPTISNLALAGHILLGLPFAQGPGVIQEINPEFRKREDGSPLLGRILIEGRDKNNNRTGITNIYFYPQGRQLFDSGSGKWLPAVPDFSGLAINPDTGREYAVGDKVTQFAPLAKGVSIQEYLATPNLFDNLVAQGNIASQLQKYHAFQIVVNSDIITATDTDLVAQFLKKAKAHYVRLTSSLGLTVEDFVDIEDVIAFSRLVTFFESSDLGTPSAVKLDEDDDNESILSLDGLFYIRYLVGEDLSTTNGSLVVQTPSGGLITARTGEAWDPPLIRAGDLLSIVGGHNSGKYTISSIVNDTQATLVNTGEVFETLGTQRFVIYRPLRNPIWSGKVVITSSNATIPVQESVGGPGGIGAAGVSVGDHLVFTHLSTLNPVVSAVYTIVSVAPGSSPTLVVSVGPAEASGTYDAWVIRNGLLTSGKIDPPNSAGEVFYVSGTSTDTHINFVDTGSHLNSWLNVALLGPGSKVTIDGIPYEVLQFEPGLRRVDISTALLANYTDKQVTVDLRPGRPAVPISVDFLDRLPSDYLELELASSLTTGDSVQSTSGSGTVTLTVETFSGLGVHPNDYLQFLSGAESTRNVGYGPGIFPIQSISGSSATLLVKPLTTGTFRYGIIRKVPNEG